MWKDKIFWFSQPSIILNNYDKYFLWAFVGLTGFGLVLKLISRFLIRHSIVAKLTAKFSNAFWVTGLIGLVWYGLRYENTPFFADRYWVLVLAIVLVVWIFSVIKYWFTGFGTEKAAFDKMQLNSKYVSGKK